jgi:hypothetical protein
MGDLRSEATLSYGMLVIIPAFMLTPLSGELARSTEIIDESRAWLCREVRELIVLAVSAPRLLPWSAKRYLPSSEVLRLSVFLLREKKDDLPVDEARDLSLYAIVSVFAGFRQARGQAGRLLV